jgi:hypothetical protein
VSEDAAIDLASDSSDDEGELGARGVSRAPIDVDNFIMDAWEVLAGRTLKPDPDAAGRPEAAQALVAVKQEAGAEEPPAAEGAGEVGLAAASEQEEEQEEKYEPQEKEEEQQQQEQQQDQAAARGGGRAELLEFLGLRAGATPKAVRAAISDKDGYGRLPIHRAMFEGQGLGLVRGLLEWGGAEQLRAKDGHGWLPIHHAAQSSRSAEVVALLVRSGPWQLAAGIRRGGHTPLALAKQSRRPEAIMALLRPPAAAEGEALEAALKLYGAV